MSFYKTLMYLLTKTGRFKKPFLRVYYTYISIPLTFPLGSGKASQEENILKSIDQESI